MLSALLAVNGVGVELSVTLTVKLKVPVLVGVPEIVPPELSVRPVGRVPDTLHVSGRTPPVAVSVAL